MWASWNMYGTVSVTLADTLYEPLSNEYKSKVDTKHVTENRKVISQMDNYETPKTLDTRHRTKTNKPKTKKITITNPTKNKHQFLLLIRYRTKSLNLNQSKA